MLTYLFLNHAFPVVDDIAKLSQYIWSKARGPQWVSFGPIKKEECERLFVKKTAQDVWLRHPLRDKYHMKENPHTRTSSSENSEWMEEVKGNPVEKSKYLLIKALILLWYLDFLSVSLCLCPSLSVSPLPLPPLLPIKCDYKNV